MILDRLHFAIASGSTAQDLLNGQVASQQTLRGSIDRMWITYIGSTHNIWTTMVRFGGLISVICLGWLLITVVQKAANNDQFLEQLDQFVWVIVIIILLINNGAYIAELARGMRSLYLGINDTVAVQLQSNNRIKEEFDEQLGRLQADRILELAKVTCEDTKKEVVESEDGTEQDGIQAYEKCMMDELQKFRDASTGDGLLGAIDGLMNEIRIKVGQGAKLLGYGASTIAFGGDRYKLFITGIAFSICADLGMLITALFGPVAAGASSMPGGSKAIYGWITGFYAIAATQIAYTLMMGLLADMLSESDSLGDYILPWLIGKALPIIAVGLGAGGGVAMYSSMTAAAMSIMNGMGGGKGGGGMVSQLAKLATKR